MQDYKGETMKFINSENTIIERINDDGSKTYIPVDLDNSDYKQILKDMITIEPYTPIVIPNFRGLINAIKRNPNFNNWFNLLSPFRQVELFDAFKTGEGLSDLLNDINTNDAPIPTPLRNALIGAANANSIDLDIN